MVLHFVLFLMTCVAVNDWDLDKQKYFLLSGNVFSNIKEFVNLYRKM